MKVRDVLKVFAYGEFYTVDEDGNTLEHGYIGEAGTYFGISPYDDLEVVQFTISGKNERKVLKVTGK